MFYHAALLFDYKRFEQEMKPLIQAIERQDTTFLYQRVRQIAEHISPETFLLRNYGEPLKLPQSPTEIELSPYRNSKIGEWIVIVMSTYLEPSTTSIGYNWRILTETLKDLGWEEQDVEKIYQGLPTGLLVSTEATTQHPEVVEHHDPYWKWIRLDYSYNQGGWLPIEECERLYMALQQVEREIESYDRREKDVTKVQAQFWKESLRQGYRDALAMFSIAIKSGKGLYMVILWDWENDEEE